MKKMKSCKHEMMKEGSWFFGKLGRCKDCNKITDWGNE